MRSTEDHLAIFQGESIRKTIHHGEWWFVISDIVVALTDSTSPSDYLKNMRKRDLAFGELFAKGGVKLTPPCLGLHDHRRKATAVVLEHRGCVPYDPINPLPQSRAIQALAREGRIRKRENLRDHMTDLEQIFSMLGEASTTEIVRSENAKGFSENHRAAHRGGAVAGNARRQLESETGQPVVTAENYLSALKDQQKPKLQQ